MTIARVYGPTAQSLAAGEINYASHAIKMAVFSNTYTPNQDTNRYFTDLTGEITGTGYTAGGVTVGSKTVTYDAGANTLTLSTSISPIVISNLTASGIRYVVFYDSAGSKPLLSYVDFETTYDSTAQDFKVGVPTTGLLQIGVA